MEHVQKLLQQKTELESELRQLDNELHGHGVDRTTQLVDANGFPRSDIDIVAIRTIRQSLVCKQNDLRALMSHIETQLIALHQTTQTETATPKRRAFARVSIVTPNSPASEAGLVAGDKIAQYGTVTASSADCFQALSTETINNVNTPIAVTIERVVDGKPETIELLLRLRRGWGGEGVLGCHILPI
ncbi:putative 26S proteasome regulatory subunit [Coemansia sp. RSA 1972]|nr:putative 26S proteasome regulatory subunit [Coemansia sp. RSA 1972]